MRIVFFLGAGFSAGFGLPTMESFLSVARDSKRINDTELKFVDSLVLDARRANSFVRSSPTNLEDILSFAVMADRLDILSEDKKPRAPQLKRVLQRIYSGSKGFDTFWTQFDVLKAFLGFDPSSDMGGHDVTVITTNYDVLFESAMARLERHCSLQIDHGNIGGGNAQQTDDLYRKDGIPLLKLHGSVNWFELDGHPSGIGVDGRIVVCGDPSKNGCLPVVHTMDYVMPGTPFIVAPSFIKPELRRPLTSIWAAAAHALRGADYVVFVGYSFPRTDTDMRYFLGRSLVDNAGLKRIDIHDLSAKGIVQRLKQSDSGYGDHFVNYLHPVDGDWTRSPLTIKGL